MMVEMAGAASAVISRDTRVVKDMPVGTVSAIFDTDVHGLGFSLTDLTVAKLGIHYRLFLLATQLDADEFEFTVGVSSEMPPPMAKTALGRIPLPWKVLTAGMVRLTMETIVHDILQDREIWAHKAFVDPPGLVKGDGPIGKFRRFARQFYPATAGGAATATSPHSPEDGTPR